MPQAIGPANVKVCGFYFLMILLFLGQSFLANPSGYKSWFHMPFRQVSYQLDAIFKVQQLVLNILMMQHVGFTIFTIIHVHFHYL